MSVSSRSNSVLYDSSKRTWDIINIFKCSNREPSYSCENFNVVVAVSDTILSCMCCCVQCEFVCMYVCIYVREGEHTCINILANGMAWHTNTLANTYIDPQTCTHTQKCMDPSCLLPCPCFCPMHTCLLLYTFFDYLLLLIIHIYKHTPQQYVHKLSDLCGYVVAVGNAFSVVAVHVK